MAITQRDKDTYTDKGATAVQKEARQPAASATLAAGWRVNRSLV